MKLIAGVFLVSFFFYLKYILNQDLNQQMLQVDEKSWKERILAHSLQSSTVALGVLAILLTDALDYFAFHGSPLSWVLGVVLTQTTPSQPDGKSSSSFCVVVVVVFNVPGGILSYLMKMSVGFKYER